MDYPSAFINGVLLPDGWHEVEGQLFLDFDATLTDSTTGAQAILGGGAWMRWTEPDGTFVFAPLAPLAFRHVPVTYAKTGTGKARASSLGTHDA